VSGDESGEGAAVAELRKQPPQFTFKTFARSECPMPTTLPVYKNWGGSHADTRVAPRWVAGMSAPPSISQSIFMPGSIFIPGMAVWSILSCPCSSSPVDQIFFSSASYGYT
jgi:hypothetical protein